MNQLKLRYAKIRNFRKIKHLDIAFNETVTDVFGRNRSGKSTILDAIVWNLYKKDMLDRPDYDVKYRDAEGFNIPKQEVEVEVGWEYNGTPFTTGRILRERWSDDKGRGPEKLKSNDHFLFWNGVPMATATEFNQKISEIIPEQVFKILSNPHYFNGMKWDERRKILTSLSGEVNEASVWEKIWQEDIADIIEFVMSEREIKSFSDIKKETLVKIKNADDEKKLIPSSINSVRNQMPEERDWDAIEVDIQTLKNRLDTISEEIAGQSGALKGWEEVLQRSRVEKQAKENRYRHLINEATNRLTDGLTIVKKSANDAKAALTERKTTEEGYQSRLKLLNIQKTSLTGQIKDAGRRWKEENEKQINYGTLQTNCQSCGARLDESTIEADKTLLIEQFNRNKKAKLDTIVAEGNELKRQLTKVSEDIEAISNNLAKVQEELPVSQQRYDDAFAEATRLEASISERTKNEIESDVEIAEIAKEIARLEEVINSPAPPAMQSDRDRVETLKVNQATVVKQIEYNNTLLADKNAIQRAKAEINKLTTREKDLASVIANLRGIEHVVNLFTKTKMTIVEDRVNQKFKQVKFRMFEPQLTSDEEKALCDTMFDGVEWGTLNTEGKMTAGLDIISTLEEHYGILVPKFLDDRDLVTEIPEIRGQYINLHVSPEDAWVRVE